MPNVDINAHNHVEINKEEEEIPGVGQFFNNAKIDFITDEHI